MKDKLSKIMSEEDGASSVLVIFMMLVLVTLGALAITSANANYKLNRLSFDWNLTYYELDSMGEEFLSALDSTLADAEKSSILYVVSQMYASPNHPDIPDEIQSEIYTQYNAGEIDEEQIYKIIYMYYADIFVMKLSLDFPDLQIYTVNNGAYIENLLAEVNFELIQTDGNFTGLDVSVNIDPVEYYIIEAGGSVSVARANESIRYRIEKWSEYQRPFADEPANEPSEELWDGSLVF